jgi:6,7-dimethyl-8-ribityllumazine synthase
MRTIQGTPDGKGRRVAVIAARFNDDVVNRLMEGALKALKRAGVRDRDITVVRVPGAFEIPAAASLLAEAGACDALVALGCVLKGETPHFEFVAGACCDGLARLVGEGRVGIGFGVITCHTLDQAMARSRPGDNRGAHAALAALEMADLLARLRRKAR